MNLAAVLAFYLFVVGVPVRPQSTGSAQPASSVTGQAPDSTTPAKPTPPKARHHKKKSVPCSTSPTASNAAPGNAVKPAKVAENGSASKPCPPPKKVVRNGGSEEPTIQLVGGATEDQASRQRSTEQLTAATDDNLKKIAGRQLSASQQEMVNQVKQFVEQSKTAVAAGDLERGNNLAQKAHLLSEELVKP